MKSTGRNPPCKSCCVDRIGPRLPCCYRRRRLIAAPPAGQPWWCACGQWRLWTLDAYSSHTSQHLADPYSLTHLQHGLVLFWLVGWAVSKWKWPWQCWLAVAIEAGWELFENSKMIIDRYREATAALGYNGDSILNSLGDILFCYAGLHVAKKLGWRNTWLLFLGIEVTLLLTIRDSLLMNILMLSVDIPWLKAWQANG